MHGVSQEVLDCDVLAGRRASVKDNWSGLNLCEEVAAVLGKHYPTQSYFSQGTSPPTPHSYGSPGDIIVGVGIHLQRSHMGFHEIKKVSNGCFARRSAGVGAPYDLLIMSFHAQVVAGSPAALAGLQVQSSSHPPLLLASVCPLSSSSLHHL